MNTTDRDLLTTERINRLTALSDTELLRQAADIIAAEPVIVAGSFRNVLNPGHLADLIGPDAVTTTEPVACHCLEGALREAAGIYYLDEGSGPWVSSLAFVEMAYEHRRLPIDRALVAQFDRDQLGQLLATSANYSRRLPTLAEIDSGDYHYPAGVVYLYSDNVLAKMGTAGPKEAERILRAAAATLESKEAE